MTFRRCPSCNSARSRLWHGTNCGSHRTSAPPSFPKCAHLGEACSRTTVMGDTGWHFLAERERGHWYGSKSLSSPHSHDTQIRTTSHALLGKEVFSQFAQSRLCDVMRRWCINQGGVWSFVSSFCKPWLCVNVRTTVLVYCVPSLALSFFAARAAQGTCSLDSEGNFYCRMILELYVPELNALQRDTVIRSTLTLCFDLRISTIAFRNPTRSLVGVLKMAARNAATAFQKRGNSAKQSRKKSRSSFSTTILETVLSFSMHP